MPLMDVRGDRKLGPDKAQARPGQWVPGMPSYLLHVQGAAFVALWASLLAFCDHGPPVSGQKLGYHASGLVSVGSDPSRSCHPEVLVGRTPVTQKCPGAGLFCGPSY